MTTTFAIANCRVSSDEQLKNNSLNRQRDAVLNAANRLKVTIREDGWWSGSVSSKRGKNIARKDIKQMQDYCKKHRDIKYLIVDEPDRFMRSVDEAFYIEMQFKLIGVTVWYASDDDLNSDNMQAKLMKFMKYFVAEGSNEERQRKSISGQTKAMLEGRFTFHPKPGYQKTDKAGIHAIHPVRGRALQKVLKRLAAGYISPTNALKELNRSRYTEDHAPYKMDKFEKIATDIFYAGILEMDKQVKISGVKGLHDPLITMVEHKRILEIFYAKEKYQTGPRRNGNPKFPLNNLMCHESCADLKNKGRLVGLDLTNGKYKKIYQKYRCRTCNRYWNKEDVHNEIQSLFNRHAMSQETQKKIINALEEVWMQDSQNRADELRSTRLAIFNLEKDIERKVESATDSTNSAIKEDILKIIDKKKEHLSALNLEMQKLTAAEEDDKREFLEFALGFMRDTGKYFCEPYLSKEYRVACKQMLFPAGFYINQNGKVYTPELGVFFRGEVRKKSAGALNNSQLVQDS